MGLAPDKMSSTSWRSAGPKPWSCGETLSSFRVAQRSFMCFAFFLGSSAACKLHHNLQAQPSNAGNNCARVPNAIRADKLRRLQQPTVSLNKCSVSTKRRG